MFKKKCVDVNIIHKYNIIILMNAQMKKEREHRIEKSVSEYKVSTLWDQENKPQ